MRGKIAGRPQRLAAGLVELVLELDWCGVSGHAIFSAA
jgi:hypothetical protein